VRLIVNARPHQLAYAILFAMLLLLVGGSPAQATWAIGFGANSAGEATAAAAPPAPTGVTSACTSALATTVKVTWTAVTHASTYEIWKSTTSSTSGFSIAATGVTGTSWTSGNLATGNYWFEVSAFIGTNWTSPNSAATAQRTITLTLCS
jgi:hypothetical protein